MPLLLLPYATTTQALSATTAQVIHGTAPYLTFDNGVTKVTTTYDLLWITLSDGTHITPATNTSTTRNPIQLPVANQSFADIAMLIPTNTNSIALSALIGASYNYWGDDDGDGQGTNGITATGNLSVRITDKNGQAVSRNTVLSACNGAPYKVELTSTSGSLTTQYGIPSSSSFSGGTANYYISPKDGAAICYARPNMEYWDDPHAGPATIWNKDKGFLVQSTEPSSYYRNFPTTGLNNLHFDLLVSGIDASTLTWPTVTQGGITATMTFNPPVDLYFNRDGASSVRVTLTGPEATSSQRRSTSPGRVDTPTLPQTFVLVGKDSSNREILKYGFVLKQWFVNRGVSAKYNNQLSWCGDIGYHLPKIKDLTNARCWDYNCPASSNRDQRIIGGGFFSEWGRMRNYGFSEYPYYWTSEGSGGRLDLQWTVRCEIGAVADSYKVGSNYVTCVYP